MLEVKIATPRVMLFFFTWLVSSLGAILVFWVVYLSIPTVKSWWSQLGVPAASHCYRWWRWWFYALWVIVKQLLRLGFLFSCLLICCQIWNLYNLLPAHLSILFWLTYILSLEYICVWNWLLIWIHVCSWIWFWICCCLHQEEMKPPAKKITRVFVARIPPIVTDEEFRRCS